MSGNRTISLLGLAISASVILGLGVFAYNGMREMQHSYGACTENMTRGKLLLKMKSSLDSVWTSLQALTIKDMSRDFYERQFQNIDYARDKYKSAFDAYEFSEQTNSSRDASKDTWHNYVKSVTELREINNKILGLAKESSASPENFESMKKILFVTGVPAKTETDHILTMLLNYHYELAQNLDDKAKHDLARFNILSAAFTGLGLFVCFVFGLLILWKSKAGATVPREWN